MSRAILLPTPGSNPFLIQTWLRNFDFWKRPDDKLYVITTWPQKPEVYEAIQNMVLERHGYMVYKNGEHLDHGLGLDAIIPMIRDEHDITLFMEDDLYVRNPGELAEATVWAETGFIVGARRWNGSLELQDVMRRLGTSGLWPHLLIAKTEYVKAVREHWGAHLWKKGDIIRPLWWRCPGVISSDTAVAATLELQKGRAVHEITTDNVEAATEISPWFHIGSLSTGPLPARHLPGVTPLEHIPESPDSWAQRVAWWQRCLRRSIDGLEKLYEEHTRALEAMAGACGRERVAHWHRKYDTLVNWAE